MKKTFFITCIILLTFSLASSAQKTQVGIQGGITISDMSGTENERNHGKNTGYRAGMLLDIPCGKSFTFQPSLSYVQKGNRQKRTTNEIVYNELRYAEIAMNVLYNLRSKSTSFFLGAGPTISFNVPSKRVTELGSGVESSTDLLFGKTPDNDFRGMDYGVNFLAGFRLNNGLFLSGTYNMGLRNITTGNAEETEVKTSCLSIQVGYIFKQ